jgi:hypothetical protein
VPAKFRRRWLSAARGKPAWEVQGINGELAGCDVMVRVDRRRWNGGEPRRRQRSSVVAAVFRRGDAMAEDRR